MAVATINVGGGSELIRDVQRQLKVPVDGILGPVTANAIRKYQARFGLPQTGQVDARTLQQLKTNWPSVFGNPSSGSSPSTSNGVAIDPLAQGGMLEMIIKTVILYGIFKVLMKVF
jgi:peptidoglycan hydrolase-like protein with peptidoglycan-binding domain